MQTQFLKTKPTLDELESRLLPGQKMVWEGLKSGLLWAEQKKRGQISAAEIQTLKRMLNDEL